MHYARSVVVLRLCVPPSSTFPVAFLAGTWGQVSYVALGSLAVAAPMHRWAWSQEVDGQLTCVDMLTPPWMKPLAGRTKGRHRGGRQSCNGQCPSTTKPPHAHMSAHQQRSYPTLYSLCMQRSADFVGTAAGPCGVGPRGTLNQGMAMLPRHARRKDQGPCHTIFQLVLTAP